MTTKTITGSHPSGYYLDPTYSTLKIAPAGNIGGPGVTTTDLHPSTVINYGAVAGVDVGITLADGGRLVNGVTGSFTGTISGVTAVEASGGATTVVNAGTLTSTAIETTTGSVGNYPINALTTIGATVVLGDGGAVTNNTATASISNGVEITGAAGTVINRGTIGGGFYSSKQTYRVGYTGDRYKYGYAVSLAAGGYVNNGANGQSAANLAGVAVSGAPANVVNNATIGAAGGATSYSGYGSGGVNSTYLSVRLGAGGTVTNGTGADVSAVLTGGIQISGGLGVVINHGSIGATANSRSHSGYKGNGEGTGVGASIGLDSGGWVANGTAGHSAVINGGVDIQGGAGTVVNFGQIGAPDSQYAYNSIDSPRSETRANSITLGAGGLVSNASATAGLASGIQVSGGLGVVLNSGFIGGSYQFNFFNRGSLYSRTTITRGVSVELLAGGTVVNGGIGDAGATLAGGVLIEGDPGGTVVNFGTIGAPSTSYSYVSHHKNVSTATAGYAVDLLSGGRLVEEGTGKVNGKVNGGGGVLELGAAAGTGTIGGIGGTITGFSSVVIDAGAGWHLTGANTIANKATLTNALAIVDDGAISIAGSAGFGALVSLTTNSSFTVTGLGKAEILGNTGIVAASGATGTRLLNNGLLEKVGGAGISNLVAATLTNGGDIQIDQGTLNVQGSVNGGGQIVIGAGATLELRNSMTAAGTVKFGGSGGVVELNDAVDFKAKVAGFGAGETLDLSSIAFKAGETVAYSGTTTSGVLTVTSGANVAKIAMLGQFAAANFAISSDGHGGTDVTYVATPAAAPALARPGG